MKRIPVMKMRAMDVDEAHSFRVELFAVLQSNELPLYEQAQGCVVFFIKQFPANDEDNRKLVNRTSIYHRYKMIACSSHDKLL